jgi:hypothetical protein
MLPKLLTTHEVADLLTARGHTDRDGSRVKTDTVKHWCQRGLFPNATRVGGPRRGYWLIPESDLEDFISPKIGKPKRPKTGA